MYYSLAAINQRASCVRVCVCVFVVIMNFAAKVTHIRNSFSLPSDQSILFVLGISVSVVLAKQRG